MKIVLVSNYLNAHMEPLCKAFMENHAVDNFIFISTTEFSTERLLMGFTDIQKNLSYVFPAFESEEKKKKALEIVKGADVAIIAHATDEYVHCRMEENKLTFLCSERFYKYGLWRRFVPSSYKKKRERFLQYKDKNLYFLTIGAYMPYDLKIVGFPMEKCFQWAYFPEIKSSPQKKIQNSEMLWAGRMVREKRPEIAIFIASYLKKKKVPFQLRMIGDGPMLPKIKRMIEKKGLEKEVKIAGKCTPEVVQCYMQESAIFLFTSDYKEGWGAVLNEAMGAGCVPIASAAAGASAILIKNGANGFLFQSKQEAAASAEKLLQDEKLLKKIGCAAYQTIFEKWSPSLAAEHFVTSAKDTQNGVSTSYKDEPMSPVVLRKAQNFIFTKW